MKRLSTAVAVAVFVTVVLLDAAYIALYFANDPSDHSFAAWGLDYLAFGLEHLVLLAFAGVAALLVARRPRHPIGWLFSAGSIAFVVGGSFPAFPFLRFSGLLSEYSDFAFEGGRIMLGDRQLVPLDAGDAWLYGFAANTAAWAMILLGLLFLFPTGRLPSRRWILPGLLIAAFGALSVASDLPFTTFPAVEGSLSDLLLGWMFYDLYVLGNRLGIQNVGWVLVVAISLWALASRFRRSEVEGRTQIKWFFLAGGMLGFMVAGWAVLQLVGAPWTNETWNAGLAVAIEAALLFLPVTVGIAIFKYRLYDIDLIIKRTLTFGSMAAFITIVYVALVVGAGRLLGTEDRNLAFSMVVTGLVAVAFQPAREKAERLAGRLVYGDRAEPYEVLAGLAHRVGETLLVEELLPAMAEAVAQGVRARAVRVRLFLDEGGEISETWPMEADLNEDFQEGRVTSHEVAHQGRLVGEIEVLKAADDPMRGSEKMLLSDLSSQAGVAFHKARITHQLNDRLDEIARQARELNDSQKRLLTAQLWARIKIERELHDRVERHLEASGDALGALEPHSDETQAESVRALEAAAEEAREALEEIRRLGHGIFPPLLDEEGLVVALKAHIKDNGSRVGLDAPDVQEKRFHPNSESAAYFCCVEALKHLMVGGGLPMELELSIFDESLRFTIRGAPSPATITFPQGVLQEMADRVEAIGGTLEVMQGTGDRAWVTGEVPQDPPDLLGGEDVPAAPNDQPAATL